MLLATWLPVVVQRADAHGGRRGRAVWATLGHFWGGGYGTLLDGGAVWPIGLERFTQTSAGDEVVRETLAAPLHRTIAV